MQSFFIKFNTLIKFMVKYMWMQLLFINDCIYNYLDFISNWSELKINLKKINELEYF